MSEVDVVERAKMFVDGIFEETDGVVKDSDAATRVLRKRCKNRVDPMSKAISAELDRREGHHGPGGHGLGDWPGWE